MLCLGVMNLIIFQMNDILTTTISYDVTCLIPKSLTKPCNQIASLKAFIIIIYSSSVADKATIDVDL